MGNQGGIPHRANPADFPHLITGPAAFAPDGYPFPNSSFAQYSAHVDKVAERMGFPEAPHTSGWRGTPPTRISRWSSLWSQRGTFLICWGLKGKSVPRQERKGSSRAKVASVAAGKAHLRR